jgi:hypothetical protein
MTFEETRLNDLESKLKDARDQLALIHSFFPRVDAKLSTLLAIETAMLAAMAAGVPGWTDLRSLSIATAVIAGLLISASLWFLYKGAFPILNGGGNASLIYFQTIACRTENQFIKEYKAQTNESLIDDVLGQVWRNSEILRIKYTSLKFAFITLGCAIVPWAVTLGLFAVQRSNLAIRIGSR